MQPKSQEAPGYFVWQAPGKPFAIHLNLDVVDKLGAEIMRGFAAVPKRGAEVGGVLLGTVQTGEQTVVRIEDFEAVACEYRRGPSYYLSAEEQDALGSAASGERPGKHGMLSAVGYYRSHTRDGAVTLGAEDLDWVAHFFPEPHQVVLLVKPFATKVSSAGFLVRENGVFPPQSPLEFPFRRREMLGEDAPPRRPIQDRERRPRARRDEESYEPRSSGYAPQADYPPPQYAQQYAAPQYTPPQYTPPVDQYPFLSEAADPPAPRRHWLWLPVSLLFLAVGIALGSWGTLHFGPGEPTEPNPELFAVKLEAVRSGDNLTVTWDRDSLAIRSASRGVLEISDGDFNKSLPLDPGQMKEGSVVYQNISPLVQFRLTVYVGQTTLLETVDWRQ